MEPAPCLLPTTFQKEPSNLEYQKMHSRFKIYEIRAEADG